MNLFISLNIMSDDEEEGYLMKGCDEEDDYPMKECRGTEPRLALLQMFSIGNTTLLEDETRSKLPSRSLSAPALCNNVQELHSTHHGQKRKGDTGDLPLTEFDSYHMMVQSSSSLASVDTERICNVNVDHNPDMIDVSSISATNIAPPMIYVTREMDTNRVHSGRSDVTSYQNTNDIHDCHVFDSHLNKNIEVLRYPVNIATGRKEKSLCYAQQHQETTGRDISCIYDTTTAPSVAGVLIPNVRSVQPHRQRTDFAPVSSSTISTCVEGLQKQTAAERFLKQTKSDITRTGCYISPTFSSNLKRENSNSTSKICTNHRIIEELKRVSPTTSLTTPDRYPLDSSMPAATARRGPPIENGDAARYGTAYNQANGRIPARSQNSNPNETQQQRNPPTNGGVVEGDLNVPPRNDHASQQPKPLFERLVTEEVQELRAYVRIVENQNRRLMELERVHGDLEVRLEIESKARQQLEATLEAREREWAERLEHVEQDRDNWKALVEAEKIKNSKLIDQVYRKDQDIHRMLQRKYDNETTRSTRNPRNPSIEQRDKSRNQSPGAVASSSETAISSISAVDPNQLATTAHKGPHDFLAAVGSAENVRNRNATALLMDMFGM